VKTFSKFGVVVLISVFLVGCATPYRKHTIWNGSGYDDEELSPGIYSLTFTDNGWTSPERDAELWRQRAADLCNPGKYNASFKSGTDRRDTMSVAGGVPVGISVNFPTVEGTVTCLN